MQKTLTISIGNSDNKLIQSEWANYVQALRETVDPHLDTYQAGGSRVVFFGFSNPDSQRQQCTAVLAVDTDEILEKFNVTFDQWLEYSLRPLLSRLCGMYRQDSIALTVGETEFIGERS